MKKSKKLNKKKKNSIFFNALKEGLEEIIAHKKGKLRLHSEFFEIVKPDLYKRNN